MAEAKNAVRRRSQHADKEERRQPTKPLPNWQRGIGNYVDRGGAVTGKKKADNNCPPIRYPEIEKPNNCGIAVREAGIAEMLCA